MQLIAAPVLMAALAAAAPAWAQQSPHRRDMQENQMVIGKAYEKYAPLAAAMALGADSNCVVAGGRKCEERIDQAVHDVITLERIVLGQAQRDYADAIVTVATPAMTLPELVEVLHLNLGEVQVILDRYAKE